MTSRLHLRLNGSFKRHDAAYRAVVADLREHVAAGREDGKRERKRVAHLRFVETGERAAP